MSAVVQAGRSVYIKAGESLLWDLSLSACRANVEVS